MIDPDGFRPNVGIILSNPEGQLLWARRVGQNAWQFPQGGIHADETPEQAIEKLSWYLCRWQIEVYFKVLKSGCRIEGLAHQTAERLKRAIAINLVIAWRIMLMTLLGRAYPDLPAEVLFSDLEVSVLRAYAVKKTAPSHAPG